MSVASRARSSRTLRFLLTVGLPLLLFAAFWQAFGPAPAGGSSSYVVTSGSSMLPTLEPGGLVVLRESDDYAVGDVVGYRDPFLDSVVLHRIIRIEGDRYVFQGDNNDYEDRYQPKASELLGRQWIYWADGGRWFLTMREPRVAGLLLGLVTAAALYRTPDRRSAPQPTPETAGASV
jgi:signal peptidase I